VNDFVDIFPSDPSETVDSDFDGVGDNADAFPNDQGETTDTDGDGVGNNADVYPEDPNETADSDNDGVGDNADVFPSDPNETADSDSDGVGDNGDLFPEDPLESRDSDSDGVGDNGDVFPEDPNETADSDNDGVGDNADVFPTDSSETVDSDSDGVGDNGDAFPNNPDETADRDSDGVGDNGDVFPDKPNDEAIIQLYADFIALQNENAALILERDARPTQEALDAALAQRDARPLDSDDDGLTDVMEAEIETDPLVETRFVLEDQYYAVVAQRDALPTQAAYNAVIAERDSRPTTDQLATVEAERDARPTADQLAAVEAERDARPTAEALVTVEAERDAILSDIQLAYDEVNAVAGGVEDDLASIVDPANAPSDTRNAGVIAQPLESFEVNTFASPTNLDSELALYDSAGTLIAFNDDALTAALPEGAGRALSQLDFSDGLADGVYFLAVGTFNSTFNSDFEVSSTGRGGEYTLMLPTGPLSGTLEPSGFDWYRIEIGTNFAALQLQPLTELYRNLVEANASAISARDAAIEERDARPTTDQLAVVIAERDARPTADQLAAVEAERDARYTEDQIRALSPDYTMGLNEAGNVEVKISFIASSDATNFAPFSVTAESLTVVDGKICMELPPDQGAFFYRFRIE